MKKSTSRVIDVINRYKKNLINLYSPNEIRHILYLLFESFLGWSKTKVHLSYHDPLSDENEVMFEHSLGRLQSGEPIQYILGEAWFNGARLKVDPRVLIPRPETEELCALIYIDFKDDASKNIEILDIGTGSGCIAIDLKRRFRGAKVNALDFSTNALVVAKENAMALGCDIQFNVADILSKSDQQTLGKYDLIVSNPPYVTETERLSLPKNVCGFEPASALFVPDHDPIVFYRTIAEFAMRHLKSCGKLYFEINEKFGDEIEATLVETGFAHVEVINDLSGKPRFIRAISKSA